MTIHYHGTPITPKLALREMLGRHFCVSFAAPQDLADCLAIGASVMLDNGAFSVHTRGGKLKTAEFYAWIKPHLGHPHWAVVPDVIGGAVEQQRNLHDGWPYPLALGAPVWHLNLPLEFLFELVDRWPRVCLGSSGQFWNVGGPEWCARMDEVFNALARRDRFLPNIHGLRMLSQIRHWPMASADSTNVAQNFKAKRISAESMAHEIDGTNGPVRWKPRALQVGLFEEVA